MFRYHSVRAVFGAVAISLLVAGCVGTGSTSGGGTTPVVTQNHFRIATATEKAQPRPAITSKTHVFCHGHDNDCYSFDLQNAVTIDSQGNFSEPNTTCDASIWDAQWVWSDSNFTLPIAANTTLPQCTQSSHGGWGDGDDALHHMSVGHTPTPSPSPSASPSPTPNPGTPTNLYIVKIDIGWFNLNVGAVAGPATLYNGQLTFPKLAADNAFQDDHLYTFFIAAFNGKSCPVPVAGP